MARQLFQVFTQTLAVAVVAAAIFSVGCCGPMGCGVGCDAGIGCNDCDGLGMQQQMVGGPLSGLRQLKRQMICGGGCGETYFGEWISTPPDCSDPCSGDQWVGGATKARPFCWQPGALFGNLYGSRSCSGAESSAPCDCGSCCGEVISDGYYEESVSTGGCSGCATGNCSRCQSASIGTGTRIVHRPATDPVTRSAKRRSDPQVQRIRR
jgi:hypothetical protein